MRADQRQPVDRGAGALSDPFAERDLTLIAGMGSKLGELGLEGSALLVEHSRKISGHLPMVTPGIKVRDRDPLAEIIRTRVLFTAHKRIAAAESVP